MKEKVIEAQVELLLLKSELDKTWSKKAIKKPVEARADSVISR